MSIGSDLSPSSSPDHRRDALASGELRVPCQRMLSATSNPITQQTNLTLVDLDGRGHEVTVMTVSGPSESIDIIHKELNRRGVDDGRVNLSANESRGEAFTILQQLATREGLEYKFSIPRLSHASFGPKELAEIQPAQTQVIDPTEQRDSLTGMRGKAVLLDKEALDNLSTKIPGRKVFVLLDFNSMSVANKCGLKGGVDEILKELKSCACEVFRDRPHEILRLGGDEFGIIASGSDEEIVACLTQLKIDVASLCERCFGAKREEFTKAEEYAHVRSEARRLFSEFAAHQEEEAGSAKTDYSTTSFRNWVCERLREITRGFLPDRRATGALAVHLAQERITHELAKPGPGVMTFSMAAVEVGESLTIDNISCAFGMGDKSIHRTKESGISKIEVIPFSELEQIKIRSSSMIVRENIREAHDQYRLSAQELRHLEEKAQNGLSGLTRRSSEVALRFNAARAPTIGHGVLLYSRVAQDPLRALIMPQPINWISGIIININHFGVYNNQFGYDRADALVDRIAKAVREEFPEALIIMDGGTLFVLDQWGRDSRKIETIRTRAEYAMAEAVASDKAIAEYRMRITLDSEILGTKGLRSQDLAFKRANFKESVVEALPNMSIKEAVVALLREAQLVKRPKVNS